MIQKMGLRNVVIQAKEFDERELQILRQDSPGLSQRDVASLRKALPENTLISGKKLLKSYQITSNLGRADSRVLGVNALYPNLSNLTLVEGAFFLPIDEKRSHQVCVLGITAAKTLRPRDRPWGADQNQRTMVYGDWCSSRPNDREEEFEGVKIENPNNDIYVPLETLLRRVEANPVENELDEIVIRIPEKVDLPEQAAFISALMASMHRMVDNFSLLVPEKLLQQSRQTQRIFNIVMGAIAPFRCS